MSGTVGPFAAHSQRISMPAAPATAYTPGMSVPTSQRGMPVWELADRFPPQGEWTEEDYLFFDENILMEYSDGFVGVLPQPTTEHQLLVLFLLRALLAHVEPEGLGQALMAPLKVRTSAHHYREPDILFALAANRSKAGNRFWESADLVMEVVSPDNPERDYWKKRNDYAAAGIAEYWIVDPQRMLITVLSLQGTEYREAAVCRPGEAARSILLPGFEVRVDACFAAGKR
jgi:Uma2 family endonuclease